MAEGGGTRAAAIDAAVDVIAARGYHALSMREVAKAAGIRAPSLYNHFAGKDDLVAAAVRERHPFAALAPRLAALEGETPEALVREAAGLVVAAVDTRPALLDLLLVELVDLRGIHLSDVLPELIAAVAPFLDRVEAVAAERMRLDRMRFLRAFGAMLMSHLVLKHRAGLSPDLEADIDALLFGALEAA
ncbi:TetR/AcrR family transcriptional regulator [Actibacterium sp. 188UL27-1]|uniref:TetR/AcrR family transcriptional regulator n=1 Tax=Actibacterium sp. 188UL27-1 TaxID=2786961 RepID=UPI00195A703F|nr:TetR/AcrR family transcriptional regulator [Actibacterium sp. 188UL27-1]MBM7067565.1 helix-turn-helix transcriptional regulator [Actibacterium sp. 188UL27-1]